MLENVTTTLPDVQKHLVDILPADAILLGHSLEFDLRALKVGKLTDIHFCRGMCNVQLITMTVTNRWEKYMYM